jgi:putative ABC transport system permease protein
MMRLWRFKAKSIFMGLGITVGVLATVLLQSISGSVQAKFLSFIERSYPSDAIVVMGGGGPMSGNTAGRDSLKMADVETVVSTTGIKEWDPVVFAGPRDVKRSGNNVRVNVSGFSERAEGVRRQGVQDGEFFSSDDVRNRGNVALIGQSTAKTLFPGESPLGAQLFIDNVPFQVKGVLEPIGVDVHGNDQDNVIEVPYTTLMDNMLRVNYVNAVTFLTEDPARVDATSKEIGKILRERHQIGEGQKDDFSVLTSASMHEMFQKSFKTFNIFVPLIGGTAFLISALVILSIMQISIKGRTPEIGLRKAMGARSADLQTQIVLEVLVIAVVASLIGLLLAEIGIHGLTPVLAQKMGLKQVSTSAMVLLVAVGAAMATGLLGGILPARRAAKLKPVEALK